MYKKNYIAPRITAVTFCVEQGFTGSNAMSITTEGDRVILTSDDEDGRNQQYTTTNWGNYWNH